MAVQRFSGGETNALSANAYGKVGYSFAGWATNVEDCAALKVAYTNCQEASFPQAQSGETNTLFAVWATNRYTIVFDPGAGGVCGTMANLTNCPFDTPIQIECGYTNYCSMGLKGWTTDKGSNNVEWPARSNPLSTPELATRGSEATVSNLTAEADGEVRLYAVWEDVGDFSKVVGLNNAVLFCTDKKWTTNATEGCVQTTKTESGDKILRARVCGPGVFKFKWCWDLNGSARFEVREKLVSGQTNTKLIAGDGSDGWSEAEFEVSGGEECEINWVCEVIGSTELNDLRIKEVRWQPGLWLTPDGEMPKYDSQAAAEAAALDAKVARPDAEVEQVISAEDYSRMFEVSAVRAAEGTQWTLTIELTQGISNEVQTAFAEALAALGPAIADDPFSVRLKLMAGLYYGLAAAPDLLGIATNRPSVWILGVGEEATLSVARPFEKSSYYKLHTAVTKPADKEIK